MRRMSAMLHHALRGARQEAGPRSHARRCAVVAGAAGALGAAVLEAVLASGDFAPVHVLVDAPLAVALRGLRPLAREALALGGALGADTAFVVFDRARGRHGREQALHQPPPQALPELAAALHRAGVRHLIVVLPHAPASLPQALQHGLATLDEQAVAALGFEHFVLVRPAAKPARERASQWLQRVAHAVLAQLHWMVPAAEQPVRPAQVAAFAVALARRLPHARPGARVAPPALLHEASRQADCAAVVERWLG